MAMTPSEAARFLGVATLTVKAWAEKGLIPVHRSMAGWRYFEEKDLRRLLVKRKREQERWGRK